MWKRARLFATLVGMTVSLGFVAGVAWILRDYVIDDAYITFRHARNLLNGAGFSFNPGDRLLSSTAPLHGLIFAGLGAVFGLTDFAHAAIVLSLLSMLAVCLLTLRLMSQSKAAVAGLAAILLISVEHWFYRFFPLETMLVLALNLATIALVLNRHWIVAGVVSGLAIMARPDSAVLCVVVVLDVLIRYKRTDRATASFVLSAVLTASLWYVPAWLYYGTPLPNTLAAKSGFASGWLVYASGLWPNMLSILFKDHILFSAAAVVLALVGSAWTILDRSNLSLLPMWALAHIFGYSALRLSFPYAWYYAPVILVTLIMACFGAVRSLQWLTSIPRTWLPDSQRVHAIVGTSLWAVMGAVFLAAWLFGVSGTWAFAQSYRTNYYSGAREEAYHLVSDWLRQNSAPSDRVAIGEIGTLGWYSDRPIVDFYGLATYELRDLRKTGNWIGAIEQIQPEYVVAVRTQPPDPQLRGLHLPNYVEVLRLPKDNVVNLFEDIVVYRRTP